MKAMWFVLQSSFLKAFGGFCLLSLLVFSFPYVFLVLAMSLFSHPLLSFAIRYSLPLSIIGTSKTNTSIPPAPPNPHLILLPS
ncbi:hypothetical protein F5Y16DRAFT_391916 [Xylariaceae sp. FL0255]|nr:hypothetical protein F5Y16DRAFT_391916 [Xylariaceae sp. FL0255]